MNTITAAIQGSGWGWLAYNGSTKKLEIVTTANQDPLLSMSFSYHLWSNEITQHATEQLTNLSSALTSGNM